MWIVIVANDFLWIEREITTNCCSPHVWVKKWWNEITLSYGVKLKFQNENFLNSIWSSGFISRAGRAQSKDPICLFHLPAYLCLYAHVNLVLSLNSVSSEILSARMQNSANLKWHVKRKNESGVRQTVKRQKGWACVNVYMYVSVWDVYRR